MPTCHRWSITPIMYPASFWFEVPSSAYVFLIVINLFIGITATVATFLLQLFEHDKVANRTGRGGTQPQGGPQAAVLRLCLPPWDLQDLKVVNSYLKNCFLIFPNYNLGHGLMEMAYNEYINEYYAKIGEVAPWACQSGVGTGLWEPRRRHWLLEPQSCLPHRPV